MKDRFSQDKKTFSLKNLAVKIGLLETVGSRADKANEWNKKLDKRVAELRRKAHVFSTHTDASLDQIEFVLGIRDSDPHPNSPITFTTCDHADFK